MIILISSVVIGLKLKLFVGFGALDRSSSIDMLGVGILLARFGARLIKKSLNMLLTSSGSEVKSLLSFFRVISSSESLLFLFSDSLMVAHIFFVLELILINTVLEPLNNRFEYS